MTQDQTPQDTTQDQEVPPGLVNSNGYVVGPFPQPKARHPYERIDELECKDEDL